MSEELRASAGELAATALRTVRTEYPYDMRVVYRRAGEAPHRPRDRHPAFWGSYDWHSAVEMHWVLVRLLHLVPELVPAEAVAVLDEHLAPAAVEGELAVFRAHRWLERPYGWGWALTLHEEAASWPGGARWAAALQPLARHLLASLEAWLDRAPLPVRHGVHPNSAFGLVRALPAARRLAAAGDDGPLHAVEDAALRWFADDTDAPVRWEPSGADFLSPVLTEAVLMAGVLPRERFPPWLDGFLPGLARGPLFRPAAVADETDGQAVHLHGLNLSRAWAMRRLAAVLPAGDPRRDVLLGSAREHAGPELAAVSGGDYATEHWLAAFALMWLDEEA